MANIAGMHAAIMLTFIMTLGCVVSSHTNKFFLKWYTNSWKMVGMTFAPAAMLAWSWCAD